MNFCTRFTYEEFNCPSLQLPQLRKFGPPKLCFSCAEERGAEVSTNYQGPWFWLCCTHFCLSL